MKHSGYFGTPLAKKLGLKDGFRIALINIPVYYFDLFADFPQVEQTDDPQEKKDFIHYFTTEAEQLACHIKELKNILVPNGMLWVSWPKKASKVPTDITEDTVRILALQHGLVDVKVCAVDEVWSGLKLVIPVKERKG